jgi:serine/threonine-protein kinase
LVGLAVQTVAARSLAHFMSLTAFEVGIAAAMAIFGAHRIEVLYEEALRARRLGQYQLRRRLGSGGMGDVYLAEHVLLRRPCALKVIRPDRAGDPRTMLRFEREVQTTATLTHPNTVQIFDYGHAADGTFYYVMEYLDGMSLEALVKRHGPLPPARAVHVLRQVCGALQEAHAVGLIHRDIKPSNILLCQRGGRHDVAKLLDFGLVQAHGLPADAKLTQEGALAGTPAYMSPEQAGAPMDLDTRSDIYSLGAVAYFLLTGQPPFAGRSAVQVLAAHLYETPAPLSTQLSNVPSELEAILLRSMMKAAAERFADVQSLEQAPADWAAAHPWTEAQAAGWWRTHGDAADFG